LTAFKSTKSLNKVDTIALEGVVNALQEVLAVSLIVYGIERRDEVQPLGCRSASLSLRLSPPRNSTGAGTFTDSIGRQPQEAADARDSSVGQRTSIADVGVAYINRARIAPQ
jgi:hypothetical protein